jgi:hypothetical protein
MKLPMMLVTVLVLAWAGLWVAGTGLLVWSSDTGVLSTRDCRYLVGVTVAKRLAPLAQRCPLLRKI